MRWWYVAKFASFYLVIGHCSDAVGWTAAPFPAFHPRLDIRPSARALDRIQLRKLPPLTTHRHYHLYLWWIPVELIWFSFIHFPNRPCTSSPSLWKSGWSLKRPVRKKSIRRRWRIRRLMISYFLPLFFSISRTDQLPTPSYILCVGYFITWTMSVAFLVGLALVTINYSSFFTWSYWIFIEWVSRSILLAFELVPVGRIH